MQALSAFLTGLLFGVGLIVSGMANPAKVIGFLDIAGAWDPSLAFVMVGAIAVGLAGYRVSGRRARSFLGGAMHIPSARQIDRPLVLGSLAFGLGWGIAGFCPGPALVALGAFQMKAFVFVAAMLAGMALFQLLVRRKPDSATQDPDG